MVGKAKVMIYADIVEAQANRDAKDAAWSKANLVGSAEALHQW